MRIGNLFLGLLVILTIGEIQLVSVPVVSAQEMRQAYSLFIGRKTINGRDYPQPIGVWAVTTYEAKQSASQVCNKRYPQCREIGTVIAPYCIAFGINNSQMVKDANTFDVLKPVYQKLRLAYIGCGNGRVWSSNFDEYERRSLY